MKKRTKIIIGVVVAALALVLLVPVVGIGAEILRTQIRNGKPANYYADTWDVAFPETAKETYSLRTEGRDWDSYSIYTVEPGDDAAFTDCENSVLSLGDKEKITEILDDVQVPEEQRPNLENVYMWKHIGKNESFVLPDEYMDNLYVLYDGQSHTVHTVISHK